MTEFDEYYIIEKKDWNDIIYNLELMLKHFKRLKGGKKNGSSNRKTT